MAVSNLHYTSEMIMASAAIIKNMENRYPEEIIAEKALDAALAKDPIRMGLANELELPDNLEECHNLLRHMHTQAVVMPTLYVNGNPWRDDYKFYRDSSKRLYLNLPLESGQSVILSSLKDGILVLGTTTTRRYLRTQIDRLVNPEMPTTFA